MSPANLIYFSLSQTFISENHIAFGLYVCLVGWFFEVAFLCVDLEPVLALAP